jgi:hypothetical protein
MPDAFDPRHGEPAPNDWAQAFARLPQEAPPAEALARFQQALQAQVRQADAPRRDRRGTWIVALASAAVLALVVGAPMLGLDGDAPSPSAPPAGQVAVEAPARPGVATPASASPATAVPATGQPADAPASTELRLVQRALPGMERAFPRSSAVVDRHRARQATDRLVAALALPATIAATQPDDGLQRLQAQSQQLEALIALARDERVGHGAGVAMTGELDAALAALDAQLQRADLAPAQRQQLWQQRVDMLEHLAGVATTQRWLAAQGAADQTTLVSLY